MTAVCLYFNQIILREISQTKLMFKWTNNSWAMKEQTLSNKTSLGVRVMRNKTPERSPFSISALIADTFLHLLTLWMDHLNIVMMSSLMHVVSTAFLRSRSGSLSTISEWRRVKVFKPPRWDNSVWEAGFQEQYA